MSKRTYLVFGSEDQSYTNKAGEVVSKFVIHYLDPSVVLSNKIESGCMPFQKDIVSAGSVGTDIFTSSILPGYFEMNFRGFSQRVGREVKASQKLVQANYLKSFTLPACSTDTDAYLVLFAKHYDVNIEGKRITGTKLFFIDPLQLDTNGYQIISVSCTSSVLNVRSLLDNVPGYYLIDFSDTRGQGGDSLIKLSDLEFIESVDLAYSVTASNVYSS